MAEGNFTNEKIIFSPEKQKELFDVISVVFSEELKTSNCFILPAVGQKAGAAMREKGFEKANKATFIAAPEYFILGYNEKNVDAISLIGYPEDPKFSTTPNADYVPTPKQNAVQLNSEQQRKLAEIFVQVFKDFNKGGKVHLSAIGLKAGKAITEAGLGRVSIELFKGASDYFSYTQDSKGAYIIFLKDGCGITMPSKAPKTTASKKTVTEKKPQQKQKKQFEDIVFERLKKTYKTNEVSVSNILIFLRNNKIVIPETISSFERLIELLVMKYGGVVRDNGEGTAQEQYVTLRKTLPVPQNVCERVELIVAEFFLDRDLIPNVDIGQALKSNGIDFKEYNYADLTAFLRSFTNIFTIVAQPAANNRFKIFVRIIPSFKEKYANVDFERENPEQILQMQFEKVVCEMFAAEKYDAIIEQAILREAINHSNRDMWECIIRAYLIVNGALLEDVPALTDWEKEAIDFEHLTANVSDEFLSSFSFGKEEIANIKQYVLDYTHKTVNYSTLAQRLQTLCGKESYLVGVVLNLGLIARIQSDKGFCFRLLMLYYARNESEKMWELWDSFAETCLNPSSIIMIVGTLFAERKFEFVLEVTEKYNSMYSQIEVVQLYAEYAKILLCGANDTLPGLMMLESRRSAELVIAFLEHTKKENNVFLYTAMLFNCITMQTEFVPLSSLRILLGEHSAFLNEIYPLLIDSAGRNEKKSIIVLRQLILEGYVQPCDQWENINKTLLDEYKEKLKSSSDENRETILYEAIELFPTESLFVDELVSVIKKTRCGDGDNLEGFIDNLIDGKNYDQVIMLYEHDSSLEIRNKIWFLRKLSYCYQQKQEPKKSLDVEMSIISSMIDEGEEIQDRLTQLITIFYDGFVSRTLISLDEELAIRISRLFDYYKCEPKSAHKYWIAMMGLALCAKNIPMLSMLHCLLKGDSNEGMFIETCEEAIQETELGYKYRVGDLQKIFEYVLTQEKPEEFFAILSRAANVIGINQDDKVYFQYRDSNILQKIEPEKIITLIISDYSKERAWELLSKYAHKVKKPSLKFVADSVCLFKFKDLSYALSNCIHALDNYVDNSLPRNMLACGLAIWNASNVRAVDGFKNAFIDHMIRCQTYQTVPQETIADWYEMLRRKKKIDRMELLMALEIAKQSSSFGILCKMIFKEETSYKTLISKDIALFIRFCSAFVYYSDDKNFYGTLSDIRELRNQIGSSDRSALVWIDDLIDKRDKFIEDDYFIEASVAILASYPDAPSYSIVSKWITADSANRLPNYDLLRNWINTFGNTVGDLRAVYTADKALLKYSDKHFLIYDQEEYEAFFKIRLFLAEKYISLFDRSSRNTNDDYLRRCKTYYGLRKIVNVSTEMPAILKEKMHKDLEYLGKLEAYLKYESGVDAFALEVKDEYIREKFIYGGITNYWDNILDVCLENSAAVATNIDAIENYYKVIDYRPIRRRLLQMYVFASAGQLLIDNEAIVSEHVSKIKDVQDYYNHINNGNINYSQYLFSVRRLTEVLQPSQLGILDMLENAPSDEEKMRIIQGIIFVLSNKDLKQFRTKLEMIEEKTLRDSVIPTLIVIQYSDDVSSMLLQMALNNEKYTDIMLESEYLVSAIGQYATYLFKCILCLNNKDFDSAAETLSLAGQRGDTFGLLYDRIVEAISNRSELNKTEDLVTLTSRKDTMPKLSFMKHVDPAGASMQQLVADFYAENLYDTKEKCVIASKIFYLIENGIEYNDAIDLIFDWGFLEIENTFDIEKKATILFEMLENIDKLKDTKSFKERFVRDFLYVLQEFDFSILLKNFKRIFESHRVLYRRFSPYENCDCYATAIILLNNLYSIDKENLHTNSVEKIKSNFRDLRKQYPQNRFAKKCDDFADLLIQQIFNTGIFEVKILNEEKGYSGVLYYQIKNIGYEIVSNLELELTFSGEGFHSIKTIKFESIVPSGLRPGQVYAGEYFLDIPLADGTEIRCSIDISYTSIEEGAEKYNKYTVINSSVDEGRLIVRQSEQPIYRKVGGAGYFEQKITQGEKLVGRTIELEKILGKVLNGQNVLLYGTNGTGKSSILNAIRTKYLPDVFDSERRSDLLLSIDFDPTDKSYLCLQFELDAGCSERNFIEALIDKLKYEFIPDFSFQPETSSEQRIASTIRYWEQEKDSIFDDGGKCKNTGLVKTIFSKLDELLRKSNIYVFYLIDQFERVMASNLVDEKHMLFLRDFSCTNIKLIIAGSNEVLEAVAIAEEMKDKLERDSWSDILSRGFEKEKIGNMMRGDFNELMTQPRALNRGNMRYSDEALEFLYRFTNGHALYSCLIGNRMLDIMSAREVSRAVIYPSDVYMAIYTPGKYLSVEQSRTDKEATILKQIFQDIDDNIAVKYIGKTLAEFQFKGERKIPYQNLKSYIQQHRSNIIKDLDIALSILLARDFITYDEIDIHHKSDALYDENKKDDDKKMAREYFFTSDLYLEHFAMVYVPELSDEERDFLEKKNQSIDELVIELRTRQYSSEDIVKVRNAVKDIIGDSNSTTIIHTDGGNVVGHNSGTMSTIGKQNIINIQNMTNAFNQILAGATGEQLLASIAELPRLERYFGQNALPDIIQRVEIGDQEAEAELSKGTEAICSDYRAALIQQEDDEEFCVWNILGINKTEYDILSERLHPNFMTDLFFAAKLEKIFDIINNDNSIQEDKKDFSPVCIMYCKIVEKMLKRYHADVYKECLPDASTQQKYRQNQNEQEHIVKFGELKDPDIKKAIKNKIMLGAFLWPINPKFKDKHPESYIALAQNDSLKQMMWEDHGKRLEVISDIRNKSAHGITGSVVDASMFRKLKDILFMSNVFKSNALLNIVTLSDDKYLRWR